MRHRKIYRTFWFSKWIKRMKRGNDNFFAGSLKTKYSSRVQRHCCNCLNALYEFVFCCWKFWGKKAKRCMRIKSISNRQSKYKYGAEKNKQTYIFNRIYLLLVNTEDKKDVNEMVHCDATIEKWLFGKRIQCNLNLSSTSTIVIFSLKNEFQVACRLVVFLIIT